MECTKPLLDLLKKCDSWKIPTFDPKKWLIEQSKRKGGTMQEGEGRRKGHQESQWKSQKNVFIRCPNGTLTAHLPGEQYIRSGIKRKAEEAIEEHSCSSLNHEVRRGHNLCMRNIKLRKRKYGGSRGGRKKFMCRVCFYFITLVAGNQVLLKDITQADQDRMTPEEYTAYYEALTGL